MSVDQRYENIASLSGHEKKSAIDQLLQLLSNQDTGIQQLAVSILGRSQDSRALFPLINLYNRYQETEERNCILAALVSLRDPRSVPWLEGIISRVELSPEGHALAKEACHQAKNVHDYEYSFIGNKTRLNDAYTSLRGTVAVNSVQIRTFVLAQKDQQPWLSEDGSEYTPLAYVVPVPDRHLVLGPLRSEHVDLARGNNVLASGEIGFHVENHVQVAYLNNRSYGYYPGSESIHSIGNSLKQIGLTPIEEFSDVFPPGGYFTEDILSLQPLFKQ